MFEKTYTQKVNFELTIKDTFSLGNMVEEELRTDPEGLREVLEEYLYEAFEDYLDEALLTITNLQTIEEN